MTMEDAMTTKQATQDSDARYEYEQALLEIMDVRTLGEAQVIASEAITHNRESSFVAQLRAALGLEAGHALPDATMVGRAVKAMAYMMHVDGEDIPNVFSFNDCEELRRLVGAPEVRT